MAKKARRKPVKKSSTSAAANVKKVAPAAKSAGKRKKKAAPKKTVSKKQKKADRAVLEKQVLAAVEQFQKETTMLATYARKFFNSLRKSGVDLPGKSRKTLVASARDLRRTERSLKKLARN